MCFQGSPPSPPSGQVWILSFPHSPPILHSIPRKIRTFLIKTLKVSVGLRSLQTAHFRASQTANDRTNQDSQSPELLFFFSRDYLVLWARLLCFIWPILGLLHSFFFKRSQPFPSLPNFCRFSWHRKVFFLIVKGHTWQLQLDPPWFPFLYSYWTFVLHWHFWA